MRRLEEILGTTELKVGVVNLTMFRPFPADLITQMLRGKRGVVVLERTGLFNLGVNNILNNENIVSGGFEQLRFDFAEKNVGKFPARKFYAYGLNYFASIGIRF